MLKEIFGELSDFFTFRFAKSQPMHIQDGIGF
jgi:hypothetical protein